MRILSSISLLLLGIAVVLSIVTYTAHDLSSGEWFLPAPRMVQNLMGPFGAWISLCLVSAAGYFSIALGLLLMVWGVGRMLHWKLVFLAKITGLTLGWLVSLAMPVAVVGGEFREALIGSSGESLLQLLSHTGSLGKVLIAFAVFIAWVLWSTGIGFRQPVRLLGNVASVFVGFVGSIAAKRRERRKRERQKILEQHRVRQEQIYRRIPESRTGDLVPGALPEELLTPPGKVAAPEQQDAETVESSDVVETFPGLQDTAFVPPPILVSERETKPAAETTETEKGEESMAPPFQPSEAQEEVIVSAAEVPQQPAPPEMVSEQTTEELPDWLMTKIPEKAPGTVDKAPDSSRQLPDIGSQLPPSPPSELDGEVEKPVQKVESSEGKDEEPIRVIETEESPGVEIDAVEVEGEGTISGVIEEISEEEPLAEEKDALILAETPFKSPSVKILTPPSPREQRFSEFELREMARKLFEALKTYGVGGKITAITPGPVITRYEFEPEPGTKVSRISPLADDLALALKARDVRIVAPLPGKGTVGIEVPNKEMETVYIRSVLESQKFNETKAALPMALGKSVAGEPVVADLARMPHLLIAGATGSGKSVCINSILTSLIFKKTPMQLRLLLIDPKRLELSIYDGIPFLIAPVIVENKETAAAFNWALMEMERRYRVLADARVRKLADYNELVQRNPEKGQTLPYIVVMVDELADLMMTVANEIEEPIARLAQMARAVGIHLVLATQRPSVDVVTGIIKANFPSRIAFKVRSKIDSRTILDMGGSERLLGQGDMLYLPSGFADPIRIHGSYISTEETEELVSYLKQFDNPQRAELSFKEQLARRMVAMERDELFWEAAKIIVMAQKGSASHLQRKLRVGYTRAASLIDQLEAAGIVGPFEGSKAREVLLKTLEELDERRSER